jgi:hypothetical protein
MARRSATRLTQHKVTMNFVKNLWDFRESRSNEGKKSSSSVFVGRGQGDEEVSCCQCDQSEFLIGASRYEGFDEAPRV